MPTTFHCIYWYIFRYCLTNSTSVQKGWELISILVQFYPPSHLFYDFIEAYIFTGLQSMRNNAFSLFLMLIHNDEIVVMLTHVFCVHTIHRCKDDRIGKWHQNCSLFFEKVCMVTRLLIKYDVYWFALSCLRHSRLRRMHESGVKRGASPSLAEIEQAKDAVINPSYFGSTLADIMMVQGQSNKHLRLPLLIPTLCDMILRLDGLKTEGIFR